MPFLLGIVLAHLNKWRGLDRPFPYLQCVTDEIRLLVPPDALCSHNQHQNPENKQHREPDFTQGGGMTVRPDQLSVQSRPGHPVSVDRHEGTIMMAGKRFFFLRWFKSEDFSFRYHRDRPALLTPCTTVRWADFNPVKLRRKSSGKRWKQRQPLRQKTEFERGWKGMKVRGGW